MMAEDTRKADYMGLEETLISASQHLGAYVDYARSRGLPLILPTDAEVEEHGEDIAAGEHGYAILEHALACVEALYAAMEDGDIVERDEDEIVLRLKRDEAQRIAGDLYAAAEYTSSVRGLIKDALDE